jgi:hypothetical protein
MAKLDVMAREMVGDGKNPNLYFVSDTSHVLACFTRKQDAVDFAMLVGADIVEDRLHGEVWGSELYYASQPRD